MGEMFRKLKQELTCVICNKTFLDPVMLKTCHHVVCRRCLNVCDVESISIDVAGEKPAGGDEQCASVSDIKCPRCGECYCGEDVIAPPVIPSILAIIDEYDTYFRLSVSDSITPKPRSKKRKEHSSIESKRDPSLGDTDIEFVEENDGTIVVPSNIKPRRMPSEIYSLLTTHQILRSLSGLSISVDKRLRQNHEKLANIHRCYVKAYNSHMNDPKITENECHKTAQFAAEQEAETILMGMDRRAAQKERDKRYKSGIGKHYVDLPDQCEEIILSQEDGEKEVDKN